MYTLHKKLPSQAEHRFKIIPKKPFGHTYRTTVLYRIDSIPIPFISIEILPILIFEKSRILSIMAIQVIPQMRMENSIANYTGIISRQSLFVNRILYWRQIKKRGRNLKFRPRLIVNFSLIGQLPNMGRIILDRSIGREVSRVRRIFQLFYGKSLCVRIVRVDFKKRLYIAL